MNQSSGQHRLAYIDGLRAVAALMVLVTHLWHYSGAPAYGVHVMGHVVTLASVPAVGFVGVDLFLVLSGFCLTWPLVVSEAAYGRMTAGKFWTRRVQRIVPAYYAGMVLVLLLIAGTHALGAQGMWPNEGLNAVTAGDVWPHLFFVHNFSPATASSINGSFWSLALEFQLYFLFPLLFEAVRRFGAWKVAAAALLAEFAYLAWMDRLMSTDVMQTYEFVLRKGVPGRWFDFVAGMAAAWIVAGRGTRGGLSRWPRSVWAAICVASLGCGFAIFCRGNSFNATMEVCWGLGFAALVCWASDEASLLRRGLSTRWLVAVGVMSYSLYLVHEPLAMMAGAWVVATLARFGMHAGYAFVFMLPVGGVIIGVAAGFYWAFERPALRYFERRRKREAAVEVVMPIAPVATPAGSLETVTVSP